MRVVQHKVSNCHSQDLMRLPYAARSTGHQSRDSTDYCLRAGEARNAGNYTFLGRTNWVFS